MSGPAIRTSAKRLLLLAAAGMACIAVFQAILPFSDSLMHAFDGPEGWPAPLLFAASFAVAAIFMVLALYPLSAAGRIRRLPFLRLVLALAGVVLVYRGLPLPGEIAGALGYGPVAETWSWGGIVSCGATLAVGLCYVVGLALSWGAISSQRRQMKLAERSGTT